MAPVTDIITITEADLARLQSWEFEEVWRAVGYVYRRRAEASKALPAVPPAIEPAPVPLAPVEAPPDVPPGRAPGEKEGAETVVLEPGAPAEPGPRHTSTATNSGVRLAIPLRVSASAGTASSTRPTSTATSRATGSARQIPSARSAENTRSGTVTGTGATAVNWR